MSGELPSVTQRRSNGEEILVDTQDRATLPNILEDRSLQEPTITSLRLFWADRRFLLRAGVYALLASALISILIPVRYQTVTRLMPPDIPSGTGMGLLPEDSPTSVDNSQSPIYICERL